MEQTTRWCPVCESPGVAIVWGYPNIRDQQRAKEDQVILGGCDVSGRQPTHECVTCGSEFISSSRLYLRQGERAEVCGVAVWPHGRRSVRVEANQDVFTVIIERRGSMLINRHHMNVVTNEVFADMWPWDVQSWATKRGVEAKVTQYENGWSLDVMEESETLELLLIKTWWRDLGRSPAGTAIERLTCDHSSPMWLPEDS